MKTVQMPGLSAPVSALALGTADFTTAEEADPVYDDLSPPEARCSTNSSRPRR